jgi:hypothetical protein
MRSASARRFRDLVRDITLEQNRELTVSEIGLVRSVAALLVRGEDLQGRAVRGEPIDADQLVRTASEARRLLAILGKRAARREPELPSLAQHLAEHYGAGAEAADALEALPASTKTAAGEERTSRAPDGHSDAAE